MQTNKSFTDSNFTSMLNSYNYNLHPGDIVAGTIFHQEKESLIVDIGAKTAGYLPHEEIISIYHTKPSVIYYLENETREFFILAYNKHSQQLILSIKRLEYIRAWKRIKQIETEDIILNIKVIRINKGGLIVNLEGLQGFVPKSHLAIDINKESVENKYIKCKLLLANEKTNQLILSHKKAIISISSSKFKIGKIVTGKIIKTKAYGVFIKIYGILALLHISEVTSKDIKDINSIFSIGDKIKVKILHIDMKQGRLSVSQRNID